MPMMQGMGWQELKEMEYDCMRRLAAFLELEPSVERWEGRREIDVRRILECENAWHAGGVLRCNISHEVLTTDRIEDCKLISEVLKDLRGS
ncbi:hypothetical protein Ancab_030246 [Ancistrocladus abbreviatus]